MLDTRRQSNRNFIAWQAVTVGGLGFYTPNGPVDWKHEMMETIGWPDEGPETPPVDLDSSIKKITPSDEELIGLTEKFPPPQKWFDTDEECPF